MAPFSPTLEILDLADLPLDISPSSVTTQFPAMRSLKAELMYSFEDLGLLLRLFPNLDDTLMIKALSPNGNNFAEFRQRSKEAQRAHTWPRLDRVVCSAKGAFLLALQCPVRRMDLEGPISRPEDKQRLEEVLRHNSPQQLSFRLEVFRGLDALDGLFPAEAADKLTHLVLCLSVQVERREGYDAEHNSPWDRFIDTLLDSMKHLRLTHLRLVFQYEVCRDRDVPAAAQLEGTPLSASEGDSVYYASEEDLHPTATRLFDTMRSLQYALLTTCGYTTLPNRTRSHRHASRWLSSKAWRIPDIHKDLRQSNTEWWPCVQIGNDEAEAVIGREELHLGSREQVSGKLQHPTIMPVNEYYQSQLELSSESHPEGDDDPYPSLNFDVLRLVCNCLTDVTDVLSFSLTCSTLREGALQRRLRISPIVLRPFGGSVERFHSFIFEDVGGRAAHIYGLKLPDFDYKYGMEDKLDGISGRLVDLLEAATHLEYLYLPTIDFPHVVFAAVETLTTLRHLSVGIHSETDSLFKLLTTMRSPLGYLRVAANDRFNLPASFLHHQMAYFASTLETLDLDDLTIDMSPLSVTSQFTALRTLKASLIRPMHMDQLEVLLRLFPNLDDSLVLNRDLTPIDTYPAVRERNKEAQKVYTWPRLDRLACYSDVAFMLALQCPIRRMDIPYVSLPNGAQCLIETLRLNAPRQLCFGLSLFDGLHGLDGLFPLEAADNLTHLAVLVRLHFDHRFERGGITSMLPWYKVLDTLLQSMQHLRTTHLRIVLHCHIHPEGPQTEAQLDLHRSMYAASEGDLARAAGPFFSSISGLQYLFLITCGYITFWDAKRETDACHRLSSQAWRAVDAVADLYSPGASRESGLYTAINSETAETVVDREDLRLERYQEVSEFNTCFSTRYRC
ncbi:hypothetical protein V8D89_011055 [Ganoderma adspersum]